uniref:NADH dehydrogenase [ubiquinone] 1 beta subcomplex subunit 11, mitochondrial n=1 Tax=Heligmosomoides polygyrus TaxID=6339 RepID=A0A183FDN0_HELPZ
LMRMNESLTIPSTGYSCSIEAESEKAEQFVISFYVQIFRPGSDSYAYDNPWPKLNGGRLDWMFGDGWRRPLAKDQGAKMVFLLILLLTYNYIITYICGATFLLFTLLTTWVTCWIMFARPDWPMGREWALREAHLEIARREKAGLPLISPDLVPRERVLASLPADEELRDFDILI